MNGLHSSVRTLPLRKTWLLGHNILFHVTETDKLTILEIKVVCVGNAALTPINPLSSRNLYYLDFIAREGGFVMITEINFGVGFIFYILTTSGSICKCHSSNVRSVKYRVANDSVDAAIFNNNV